MVLGTSGRSRTPQRDPFTVCGHLLPSYGPPRFMLVTDMGHNGDLCHPMFPSPHVRQMVVSQDPTRHPSFSFPDTSSEPTHLLPWTSRPGRPSISLGSPHPRPTSRVGTVRWRTRTLGRRSEIVQGQSQNASLCDSEEVQRSGRGFVLPREDDPSGSGVGVVRIECVDPLRR